MTSDRARVNGSTASQLAKAPKTPARKRRGQAEPDNPASPGAAESPVSCQTCGEYVSVFFIIVSDYQAQHDTQYLTIVCKSCYNFESMIGEDSINWDDVIVAKCVLQKRNKKGSSNAYHVYCDIVHGNRCESDPQKVIQDVVKMESGPTKRIMRLIIGGVNGSAARSNMAPGVSNDITIKENPIPQERVKPANKRPKYLDEIPQLYPPVRDFIPVAADAEHSMQDKAPEAESSPQQAHVDQFTPMVRPPGGEALVPVAAAAEQTGLSPRQISQLAKDGVIQAIMHGREYFVSLADAERHANRPGPRRGRPPKRRPVVHRTASVRKAS